MYIFSVFFDTATSSCCVWTRCEFV